MDGVLNIYKEKGYTSHDVVSIIKKMLNAKKVGHAGTLDPDAEGVLVILLGRGTKLSDYLMDSGKEYLAEITFGIETDTYDSSGKIVRVCPPSFTEDRLKKAITEFTGEQMQIPPMYSAIKSGGQKLYRLARKGEVIERQPRRVVINGIDLESYDGADKAVIYIKCGKGTYIRSLCHDIGVSLGCGAHMSALVRTKSGGFEARAAIKLSELKKLNEKDYGNVVIPIEAVVADFSKIIVKAEADKLLYNGGKIENGHFMYDSAPNGEYAAVYDEGGALIGIYSIIRTEKSDIRYIKPKTML